MVQIVLQSVISAPAAQDIALPAEAPGKRTVALHEVWRLGADADDVLLGLVSSGVLDEDGNTLLVDEQLAHVVVVSADGEVTGVLGREGETRTFATLSVFDLDGTFKTTLIEHEITRGITTIVLDEQAEWSEFTTWALGCGGLVATGRSTIERRPLATDPAIVDLHYARDGRLFVTSCLNTPRRLGKGVVGCYEVISPAGEFAEELTITYDEFDPERDVVVFLDGTHDLIIRNHKDAWESIHPDPSIEDGREDGRDGEPLEVVLARM